MTIGLNMGQIPPDWEWTDAFGDTMQLARKERQANQITTELVAEMRRVREAVSA